MSESTQWYDSSKQLATVIN